MISSRGDRTSARASESRCRCPPDSVVPRSPSRAVEAVGQRGDEPVGLRRAQRLPHLVVATSAPSVDVAADGVVEEEGLLRHQRHVLGAATRRPRSRRSVPSTRIRLRGPGRPAGPAGGERALARGGRADHRDGPAGAGGEGEPVEQRRSRGVAVGQAVDLEEGAGGPLVAADAPGRRTASRRWRRAPPRRDGSRPRCAGTRRAASRASGSGRRRSSAGSRSVTTSPASACPPRTRGTPTASTASTPRFGSASSTGSKTARTRPARTLVSRSWWALRANRSVSSCSRPRVLTTMRAVEGLVGDLADLGAQRLGPGHQRRLDALEDDVGDDHQREDQQPDQRHHQVGEAASAPRRSPSSRRCRPPSAAARSAPRRPRRRSWRWRAAARWGVAGATPSAAGGTAG